MAQYRTDQYNDENEQDVGGENTNTRPRDEESRESPSSCVGYGGGDDNYTKTENQTWQQGHWEGDNVNQDQFGPGNTVGQQVGSRYGTVAPNASADEAGFGSSGPGGYPEGGSYAGMDGSTGDGDAGYDSEVRGGVPHKLTSDGVVSGAGVTNDDGSGGARNPSLADIEQHQYHLEESHPSFQKKSPYSQQLTQPREDLGDKFEEDESIQGNTKGGTAFDHHKEVAGAGATGKEGFMEKLMNKLPGHSQQDEAVDDRHSDIQPVDLGRQENDNEDEKPGVITKVKDKLRTNHEKHRDEINPEIFN